MYDPILIILIVFGGPLVGLIEGLVHKRGWVGTIINVLVAGAFGVGAAISGAMIVNPSWGGALILLYFAPVIGSSFGVVVVLRVLRRERRPSVSELLKVAAYFGMAGIVLLGLVAGSLYLFAGSTRYTTFHTNAPATLGAWQMAGAQKITIAVSNAHTVPGSLGTLNTTTATDIAAATQNASIRGAYRLRIINVSSNMTWTIAGGTGVTVHGTTTIAPNAWRDFSVTLTTPSAVSIQSIGAGVCASGLEPSRCAL